MQKNVLIEFCKTRTGFGAHAPHFPGCVAVGETLAETRQLMLDALQAHIGSMLEDGEDLPEDSEHCEILAVEVPERVESPV